MRQPQSQASQQRTSRGSWLKWTPMVPPVLRPNVGHQARRAAGAQRTLYAVACMPLFGVDLGQLPAWPPYALAAFGKCAR